MASGFNAKVYTQRAQARLAKFQKTLEKANQATVQDIVNVGKEMARVLVPKGAYGWLYNSIQGTTTLGPSPVGKIYLSPKIVPNDGKHRGKPGENSGWKFINFNLARWMHTAPVAKRHFKGRTEKEVKFMYSTRDFLNRQKKTIAIGNFNKIKTQNR